MAVTRGLGLPPGRLAGRHTDAASKHPLCYFNLYSELMVTRIDVHLQSGNISVYWLWLLLDISAVSVVIVIIAICDMPRQEFSLCERVCVYSQYVCEKQKVVFWNTSQISSQVSRRTCA